VSKKEEKKVLDEADEEKIFEDTIRVLNEILEDKKCMHACLVENIPYNDGDNRKQEFVKVG